MGKVLEFTLPTDPGPFKPAPAVRQYLTRNKCNAVVWGRIPADLKHYLQQEADASDRKISAHVARILATWSASRSHDCQLCLACGGKKAA